MKFCYTRKHARFLFETNKQEPVAGAVAELLIANIVAVVPIPIDERVKVPNSFDVYLAAIYVEAVINNKV